MFSENINGRLWLIAVPALLWLACNYPARMTAGKGKLNGNGYIVYTKTLRGDPVLDTLINQKVGGIATFKGPNFQLGFRVGAPDSPVKFISTVRIYQAVITAADNRDSLVYCRYAGDTWQVLKVQKNCRILFRSHQTDDTWYDSNSNTTVGSVDTHDIVAVLKNDKKIRDIPYLDYDKETLLKFVNKRYQQQFKKKNFSDVDQLLDYILKEEAKAI